MLKQAGLVAFAAAALAAGCSSAQRYPDPLGPVGQKDDPVASALLADAKDLYDRELYGEAIGLFEKLSDRTEFAESYASEGAFYAAECLFRQRKLVDAYYSYEKLLTEFRRSERFGEAVDREYVIGAAFCTGEVSTFWNRRGFGAKVLLRALEHRPFDRNAAEARMIVGDYYFEKGNYDDALLQYDLILSEYPDSPDASTARYRRALCLYNNVQGNRYDSDEISYAIESLRLAEKDTAARRKSDENDHRLADIQVKLHDLHEMAARENYDTGQHFLRNKNKKAAAAYFNAVINETPDSSYVDLARQALAGFEQELNQ